MATPTARHRVFVIGVGMTRFNKPGEEDYPSMAKEAGTKALRDAGIQFSDVQQAIVGYVYGDSTSGQRAIYEIGLTGIPIVNVNNNCSTGSSALFLAKQIVEGGVADCVMALGFEKMQRGSLTSHFNDRTNPLDKHVETMLRSTDLTTAPVAPQMFGNAGREHMKKFGTSRETFAKIAVKNHNHSVNNPYSQFKDSYSLQQVLASPEVHSPLTKLQCCPTSDGSAAAIVCSEVFIMRHPNRTAMMSKAVEILGIALTTDFESSFKDSCIRMVGFDMSRAAADSVYKQANLGPQDVQVIELHDCFSANELITYEALGLAPEGQGARLIEDGQVTYGGRWVVNPSGGLISKGHPLGATGLAQCSELCWQLRGQCGKRQVPGAKVALQHNIGLGGAAVVALYRRGWPDVSNPNPNEPNAAVDPNAFWTPLAAQKSAEKSVPPAAVPAPTPTPAMAPAPAPASSAVATDLSSIKSAAVFNQIQKRIATEGADLVKRMNGVLVFNISANGKTHVWTVDLKNGNGSMSVGQAAAKPDCTFNATDDNFVALATGKLDPTMAFMSGKLKIQGNMGMAMKLGPLLKSAPQSKSASSAASPAAAKSGGAAPEAPQIKSAAVFEQMKKRIADEGPALVKRMNGILAFNINSDGKTHSWTVDLKNGNGSVRVGAPEGKPDCTFTTSDDNFAALATGKLDPTMAFMGGKLKLQGNMSLAMKLGTLLKPQSKL